MKSGKKLKGHKRFRVTLQLVFIFTILFSTYAPLTAFAEDGLNSNDRRMQSINLGRANQQGNNLQDGALDNLTGDQLKTLGVFISNYYVPFSTQVGKGRNEEEDKAIKQQMVDSLTKTNNFTEDTASAVVDAVLGVSSKPQPLYFAYSTNKGDSYKAAKTNNKNGRQATFYEFLDQVSGYAYKLKDTANWLDAYPDSDSDLKYSIFTDPNYGYKGETKTQKISNRGAMYWSDSEGTTVNEANIVFDWNPAKSIGGDQTASQTVMASIYNYLDAENSVGTSFLDYTKDERGFDKSDSDGITKFIEKNKLQNETIEELYKRSMYDWKMYVDAFGNILADTGVRQYVVVPAAMNPYVFKKDGVDQNDEEFQYGRAVPLNNIISVALDSQKDYLDEDGDKYNRDEATLNLGNYFENFPTDTDSDKKALYKFPGSGDTYWNEGAGRDWDAVMLDALTTQYGINKYSVKKKDGWGDWLKFNGKSKDVDRYTKKKDLQDKFQYGFNVSTSTNHIIHAPRDGINNNPSHWIIQDIVAIDNLAVTSQMYSESEITDESIKRAQLWDDDGKPNIETSGINDTDFGEKLSADRNKLNTASSDVMKNYSSNFYLTYVMAGLGAGSEVGFEMGWSRFPSFDGTTLLRDIDPTENMQANNQEVLNMAYWFLHPTEAPDYISRWFKTKLGGILVGWHNDMTGASSATNTTGMTKYIGFSGFTTMPSLNDMQWTSWMVDSYLGWGIFLIIAVVIAMIVYVVIGEISIQRAIIGIGIFSICLYLPPTAINSTVGVTNSISDSIYSNKFIYWGISQLQSYSGKVDELAEAGKEDNAVDYTSTLLQIQGGTDGMYSNNTSLGNGVTLKWMTPKKDDYLGQVQKELEQKTGGNLGQLSLLTDGLLKNSLSNETYLDSSNALYLYRTFSDITNYSRFYYGNMMGDNVFDNGSTSHDISDIAQSLDTVGMSKQYNQYMIGTDAYSLYDRKNKGFINDEHDAIQGASSNKKYIKRLYAPLSSQTVSSATNIDINDIGVGDNIGVTKDDLSATIKNYNNHQKSMSEQLDSDLTANELVSTSSFALFTESPYYYFSWGLYDNGMQTKSGEKGSFSRLMLQDNDRFFYNYQISKDSSGYGELKDYLDMGSMFNTLIPYLKNANSPLEQWGSIYGLEPYMDVSTDEGDSQEYGSSDSESYYKYWYNVNLGRLYNMYTPWVDAMYDSSYAKPEKIEYGGKKQTVTDPINPESYTVRPMVFSESEMAYYGLKEYNLTEVERRIIKVQRDTRNDLLQLMNYSDYDDSVLNSTASMIMTFNFNKEFSDNNFMAESFVQYPQGFELKNFTYDAYLRLILSNTTGESLTQEDDMSTVYERVVEKSSVLTGILLIIGDVIAVYAIPVMKFVFLVVIFVLSVLTIFAKSMRADISFKSVLWDGLIKPLISFCAVTILHSLLVSFFMTNGATGVTGETSVSISLGDPSMTLIVLMLVNIVAVILYFLIIASLIRQLITYAKLSFNIGTSVFASALSYGSSKFRGAVDGMQSFFTGSSASRTPNASSYNDDPSERGRNNVHAEDTVYDDARTREINEEAYAEERNENNTPKFTFDVNESINNGRRKIDEDDDSRNLGEYDFSSLNSEKEVAASVERDTLDERMNDERGDDKDDNLESRRKHADDVKDKYNLD